MRMLILCAVFITLAPDRTKAQPEKGKEVDRPGNSSEAIQFWKIIADAERTIPKGSTKQEVLAMVTAAAALSHLERHRRGAIGLLIDLLEDDRVDVRNEAIEALFSLVGDDHGYEPDAPPEDRAEAVQIWRRTLA